VTERLRELDGVMMFVIVTVALTAISAFVAVPAAGAIEPTVGSILRASAIYAAVVGWQPLVASAIARRYCADPVAFDEGLRSAARRHSAMAVVIVVFLIAAAFLFDSMLGHDAGPSVATELSASTVARLVIGFFMIVTILWIQAIAEELAWRSYVLPRLMRTLGAWPGLVAHGVLWGLAHAPLFAVTGASVARSLNFVVTCALLGIVMGWLRLTTRSVLASASANTMLTLTAGLPMLLLGEDSQFSAVFGPAGWPSMLAVIAVVLLHRRSRASIAVPWRRYVE
jgi:membrane protease YdiL (CAAX protease family)